MKEARIEVNAAMQEAIAANSAEAETDAAVEVEAASTETGSSGADGSQAPALPDAPTLVRFATPYRFEGKTYTEIDLSGLETLTAKDMVNAESWLTKHGIVSALPEMTYEYVSFMASVASGQPMEFFKGLSPRNAIKVKNKVTSFFYGQD